MNRLLESLSTWFHFPSTFVTSVQSPVMYHLSVIPLLLLLTLNSCITFSFFIPFYPVFMSSPTMNVKENSSLLELIFNFYVNFLLDYAPRS